MERPTWAPDTIDLERPSAARVYDFLLGGSHNFAVDRALAKQILEAFPEAPEDAQANRAFLRRAVRYCCDAGIRQFIDIGSGIPTVGNVHQVAQEYAPEATAVYVDLDPVAVAHSQSILADNPRATMIQADLRHPRSILEHPRTRELIDFTAPVALLTLGVMHFVSDDEDPAGTLREYADQLGPGSHLVLSHIANDINPDIAHRLTELSAKTTTPGTFRGHAEVLGMFDGWILVEPGLVPVHRWRPDTPADAEDTESSQVYAGVGRKEAGPL